MFTGITQPSKIEKIKKSGSKFLICVKRPSKFKTKVGDSVNINGVCSTVIKETHGKICFEYMEETLKKTNAGDWKKGDIVNIEHSLGMQDLLGGHLIGGHIECLGEVKKMEKKAKSRILHIEYPKKYYKYIVTKGSVSINGVSLTVIEDKKGKLSVSLVDHTIKTTNLGKLKKHDKVNLEFDLIAKYLEKIYG
ncbi:riboflavin synthase [Patescibacteria group bacterium]|nr:riboflavin synthase [Patescibacteria group bacterium]MBU1673861.1 riboflavin synthase [Patescibacteria group bacterium]MBU1963238.1 riboflavin synthase [Patescibacteria group bacterium]